jgi:hypothetical protein
MLLISFGQISPWVFGGLCFLIIFLSLKETLSPLFTIILLVILGGSFFSLKSFFPPQRISSTENQPINLVKDNIQPELTEVEKVQPKQKTTIEKSISQEKKSNKIENLSSDKNPIPQEYEVTDHRLWTYKISSYWKWDKSFVDYFEEKTGWKKTKKGNYEITIKPIGNFTQKINNDERLYVYPGGKIEIRVNGKLCCCENIVSIPEGISHSQLVKAKEILQDTISNLLLENKEKVITQLQKCF